jgi:hypothetical protein
MKGALYHAFVHFKPSSTVSEFVLSVTNLRWLGLLLVMSVCNGKYADFFV